MGIVSLVSIVVAILTAVYVYLKRCSTYWQRRGLDYIEPELFFGNNKKMEKEGNSFGERFRVIYKEFKSRGLKHGGCYVFFKPIYVVTDPELIKCILQKDFNHFVNHGMYVNEDVDPLTGHLFNLEDAKWRNLRVKLTPTFTSGKMKMMFQTLVDCATGLEDILNHHAMTEDAVDIKEILARFTTDIIGSCAFGLECNSLKNPDAQFRRYGRKVLEGGFPGRIRQLATLLIPRDILIFVGFKQTRKEIESFFMNVVKDTVEYREKNNIFRKDFMHLLLQLKNRGKVADDEHITEAKGVQESAEPFLTMNELTAQCFVFFLAGFETSATTMTFALYELAVNENVQEKLRDEIRRVMRNHDNKLTYEAVMDMTYMDKVINETLRKHPPIPGLPRICNKAYKVPGTNVVIEPGTRVHIPVYGIQTDPEYYPDPERFDPERFSEENKAKRPAFTFLPFGEGPRICIGLRFGILQSKVGLTAIISNYKVTLNEKTETPLKLDNKTFIPSVKGGIWLNISKLD